MRTKFVLALCAAVIMLLAAACGDGPDVGSVSPETGMPGSISTPNPQLPPGLQEVDSDPSAPFRFFVDSSGGQTVSCRNANEFVMDMYTSLTPLKVRDHTGRTFLVKGFFFGTCAAAVNQQVVVDFQIAVVMAIPDMVAARSWSSLQELKAFIQAEIDSQAAKLPQGLRDSYDSVVRGEYFLLDYGPVGDLS